MTQQKTGILATASAYLHGLVALGTTIRRAFGVSDLRRWRNRDRLSADWDSRTKLIATLIPPGSSIIEFGAGRVVLKEHLPEGCTYTPSDIVDRGPGTVIYDLNAKVLPVLPPYDVAVFSGVLEYVNDLPRLVSFLSRTVDVIVASYVDSESVQRKITRRSHGWVNDLTRADIEALFETHGFTVIRTERWNNQKIYLMSREGVSPKSRAKTK